MNFPEPSSDALEASNALKKKIADEIKKHSGWISFAKYMQLALYEPGSGYYSAGSAKLGKDGDFITAPEITSLFGSTLAHVVSSLVQQTAPRILEIGAGTGRLASDILTELAAIGVALERYEILEVSGELRQRQQEKLKHFHEVAWLDKLPELFSGVVIGNEVLDAMPVQLVIKHASGWREMGVTLTADEQFEFCERDCDASLLSQIAIQIPQPNTLPAGYITEVHPYAHAFVNSISHILRSGQGGAAIFIDYGFPANEYYLAERNKGTLMCHYRHRAHDNPFYLPGLQDITSHIDFSTVARAVVEGGLELLCYTTQAAFLLAAGMTDLLLRISPEEYYAQTQRVKMLLSPAEMGELFKVMVLGKNIKLSQPLIECDKSEKL